MSKTEDSRVPLIFIILIALLALLGFAILLAITLAAGGGVAWVLHRYWPSINTGIGMLIGLAGIALTMQIIVLVVRVFTSDFLEEKTSGVTIIEPDDKPPTPYFYEPPPLRRLSRKRPPRRPRREAA
jgi:hypothetical protein